MTRDIPVVILAGGLGTRISEESINRPKPMILIGDQPLLWHIMNIYSAQGFTNFIIATGYKHEIIDSWAQENSDNKSWGFECSVRTVNTGKDTQTGGRIKRIIAEETNEMFLLTYGDGLANVSIKKLIEYHLSHGKIATVTSVRPPARFGHIESRNGKVIYFGEKNNSDSGWINGGFFIINREIIDYISGDSIPLERFPMENLVKKNQLMTYQHFGFWQPMDTLREKQLLEIANEAVPKPWMVIDGVP
jgi:glucose-1-phosphate cytidylyltransferase